MACKYVRDFEFPSDKGYSASAGKQVVRSHLRSPPKFARGGVVNRTETKTFTSKNNGNALQKRAIPTTIEDAESGGKSPVRPGFAKGGRAHPPGCSCKMCSGGVMRKAAGGPVAKLKSLAKSGQLKPRLQQAVKSAAKQYGNFNSTPMIGK